MKARAQLLGFSLHQLPVLLPLGLFVGSVGADLAFLATGNAFWARVAFRLIGAGAITALVVAPIEFIDWLATPHTPRTYRINRLDGWRNMGVIALFVLSWFLRLPDAHAPSPTALVLSWAALGIAGAAAWLSNALLPVRRAGDRRQATLGAPRGRPARAAGPNRRRA
ncbi:MAG: DUF2231 domain-containing protein [Gemmatimonadales bacterium]